MNNEIELRRADKRRHRREQRRRLRTEGLESYSLTMFEKNPIALLHATMLLGLFEPYIYPSLPPLMVLMSRMAHVSPGVEAHARDAFNFSWCFSMAFALITAVTLLAGQSNDVTDVTIFHAPILVLFGVLVVRAIVRIRKDKPHHYPLHFRLVRSNGEASFMGRQ